MIASVETPPDVGGSSSSSSSKGLEMDENKDGEEEERNSSDRCQIFQALNVGLLSSLGFFGTNSALPR